MPHILLRFTGAAALTLGVLYLGFGVDRADFWSLFRAFALAFGGYLALVWRADRRWLTALILLGVALRVALVFAFPLLSDDVYRFIWDGQLIAAGENPFAHLPAYYLEAGNEVPGLTRALFDRLNSPEYHTIYPPVAQGVFTAAAWLSPGGWYGAAVVMKLFLLGCELGSLWLLWRLMGAGSRVRKEGFQGRGDRAPTVVPRTNLLFYWLNPLIIVEITGNLHFEGAMVFFLLLAYYLLVGRRWAMAGVAMAASVASKLLPLLLLPLLIRRLWRRTKNRAAARPPIEYGVARRFPTHLLERGSAMWKYYVRPKDWVTGWDGRRFWVFSVAFGAACLLFFAPFLSSPDFIAGFRSSLELYQSKFEFNASLYYLAREVGYLRVGWNLIATIGPWLAKFSAVAILLHALLDRRRGWGSLSEGWLWAFLIYLLCATTVHPWYLSVPIALSCFTRWRFPLVWSFLIMLTYTSYVTVPYAENLWLVAGEYAVVVGVGGWEWRRLRTF